MMRSLKASTSKEVIKRAVSSSSSSSPSSSSQSHQSSGQSSRQSSPPRIARKVLISALPVTASVTDIRLLAYKTNTSNHAKDPKPNPQAKVSVTPPSTLSSSMYDIKILRSKLLNPLGKAIVSFHDAERAKEFAEMANRRAMGGHTIRAQLTTANIRDSAPVIELLSLLQKQSPGRVVLLKGFPENILPQRVTKLLSKQYQLAQDTVTRIDEEGKKEELGPVVKLVNLAEHHFTSSFFVRLASVSDATMLVRRWHRSVFFTRFGEMRSHQRASALAKKEEMASAATAEEEGDNGKAEDMMEEEEEEDEEGKDIIEEGEEARDDGEHSDIPTKWQAQTRKIWDRAGEDKAANRCMIDAYLMH